MNKLFTKIAGVAIGLTMAIGAGVSVGNNRGTFSVDAGIDTTKITNMSNVISGHKYYIGATVVSSSTDYYFQASTTDTAGTGYAGTAVTSMASATPVTLEGSGNSWAIKFASGKYMSLKNGKDNGKYTVVDSKTNWTVSNSNNLLVFTCSTGTYMLQKNGSGTQFGSYSTNQTKVWLMDAVNYVESVTLNKASATINVGETETLTATITPNSADDKTLTWTSSDTAVATVTQTGVVSGVATGTTTITATAKDGSGKKGTCTITVQSASAESIEVTGSSSFYIDDETTVLIATPSNFAPTSYTWASSDPLVATVSGSDKNGTVTALKAGTTTITASAQGSNGTVVSNDFSLTVKQFRIALSDYSLSLKSEAKKSITVTPTDADGTVIVSAQSNDTSVATVEVSGSTVTVTAGSNGGVTTTITIGAVDKNNGTGHHTAENQSLTVDVQAGYIPGTVVTALPSEDTLVYLIANKGSNTEYYVTKDITATSTSIDNAALYYLSSSGTLQYFNDETDTRGKYISHGSSTTVSAVTSNPTGWTIGNATDDEVVYENLILDGDRFLSDNNNSALKAYATSNLDNSNYHPIKAYLAVAASPTATLSGSSVSGLKGDPNNTDLTLTLANFTASGLSVSYLDAEETEYADSSDIATVTCGHATGENTVTVSFGAIGSTTVKLTITRSSGADFEKTFTVSVKQKPGTITINNTLKDGYLKVKNGSTSSEGFELLDITAKQASPDSSSDYTGPIYYSVTSGSDYVGVYNGKVYGKAVGKGVVRAYAKDLASVYAEINVDVIDDYRNGVSSVTYKDNLTANAGDALNISAVFASKVATTYFGGTDAIDDSELKFSYSENDYENAVPAANFIYECDESTAVDDHENQIVYVYCTLDESWSSSFNISVTQTSNPVEGITMSNVTTHAQSIVRNQSFQIELVFTPTNATNKNVSYSLSNESTGSTISVSQTGLISAGSRADSRARVTVTTQDGGFTDYVDVSVTMESMSYEVREPISASVASSIAIGDKIFFAAEGTRNSSTVKKYMTGYTSSYGEVSDYTDSPDASEAYVLEVVAGAANGQFAFKYGSNYLSYSGSSNTLNTTTSVTNISSWTVSISDGKATITNVASTTRVIWYNAGSPRFACYTNKTHGTDYFAPIIYKVSGGDSTINVTSTLLNAVLDNFGEGKTYAWSESCEVFNSSAWESAGSSLTGITGFSSYKLNRAVANANGNDIERFLAKYDFVISKSSLGATDFLHRFEKGGIMAESINATSVDSLFRNDKSTTAIIAVISVISVSAIGGYFFLRKRKVQ